MGNFCLFDVFRFIARVTNNLVDGGIYLGNTHLNQVFEFDIVSPSLIFNLLFLLSKILFVLLKYLHMI